MRRKNKKQHPTIIGRRTKVDVVQGKRIRRQDDGTDVFEDYWTDNDSVCSNQTTQSIHSPDKTRNAPIMENASILNKSAASFRSSREKSVNQRNEEFENHRRNSGNFSGDGENSLCARTKLTQTSYVLNDTENSPSKHINKRSYVGKTWGNINELSNSYSLNRREDLLLSSNKTKAVSTSSFQKIEFEKAEKKKNSNKNGRNEGVFLGSEKNSFVEKSSVLSSTLPSSNQKDRSCSRNDANVTRASISSIMVEVEKIKDKIKSIGMIQSSQSSDEIEGSPINSAKFTHEYWKESERNTDNLSDIEKNSSVGISRILSETSTKRREDLPSTRDQANTTRASLFSNVESGKKVKGRRNSRSMTQFLGETEGSPTKHMTFTNRRSYLKESGKDTENFADNEKNSSVKISRVLSETLSSPNRRDLRSARDGSNIDWIPLFGNIESGKKTKDKINSRSRTQSSSSSDEMESSPSENATFTCKTSYSKDTERNTNNLSDNEINSIKISTNLPETLSSPNRRGDLPSVRQGSNTARASLSSNLELDKKTEGKRNSRSVAQSSDETECSPTKNTSFINERSYSEETGRNGVESSDENSSLERSRIPFKPSSSNNSRKKVIKKNSYRGKSLQRMAKSFEILSQKENKSSQRGNQSEILVSGPKENEKGRRKSFMTKSLLTVKRKLQISDISNSMSNTPCVRNGREESPKRNFSGGKSPQPSVKSSEMPNLKNISSRSNKSISMSEMFHQKQNKDIQRTSIEKSPNAFKNKLMEIPEVFENKQLSNKVGSPVKTASPVHSAKCTNDNAEVRKSSRMRFPRLASWKNERLKYVRTPSGTFKCSVVKGKEDDFALKTLEKKLCRKKVKLEPSIKKKSKKIKKTSIVDIENGTTVELNLHRPYDTYDWILPRDEVDAGYMLCRVFTSDHITFGFLNIAAHRMKDRQFSPTDNVYFVVLSGVVDVVINTTSFNFTKGDCFIVPVGSGYSIANNSSRNAILNFTSFKLPFFKYQEKY